MKVLTLVCVLALPGCFNDNVGNTVGALDPTAPAFRARWALDIGGDHDDAVASIALDPNGDVIAAGSFQHQADFGSGLIVSPHAPTVGGASDELAYQATGFVTKRHGADGTEAWTITIDGLQAGDASAVATDGSGNVYVAANVVNTIEHSDPMLIKLDTSGVEQWRYAIDPEAVAVASSVAIGPDGTVFLGGSFQATIDLGDGPITAPDFRDASPFVVALTPDGTQRWGKAFVGHAGVMNVVAAGDGVVIGGVLNGPTDVSGDVLVPIDRFDGLVARFDAAGELDWAQVLSSTHGDTVGSAEPAVLPDGSVAVASQAGYGLMLNTFTAAGSPTGMSFVPDAVVQSIAVSREQVLLTTGLINAVTVDFGNGPLSGRGFIAANDLDAAPIGGTSLGSFGAMGTFETMASNAAGLAIGAWLGPGYDFGTGALAFAGGSYDAVIVMFDQSDP